MKNLPTDPLQSGLEDFARRLRSGHITSRAATEAYLDRIAYLNPKLEAYSYVAVDQALKTAEALDHLLDIDIDLGPLMGVPVAVKDLFAVSGMPARAGSNLDLKDCIGSEGKFINLLRKAGCVILGKTRTIEFAAGAQNLIHPTPWNPCNEVTHLTPGGSSSGSAVAVAAGLCGFAIGSDTGGSVRQPAALCGVVGFKPSYGLWPTDGIFPLCPSMDTVGLLTASPLDASVAYAALHNGIDVPTTVMPGLRLGVPEPGCMEPMDANVAVRYEYALKQIELAGATLVPVTWPTEQEQKDIKDIFAGMVPADLLATLGFNRFKNHRNEIDPVAVRRIEGAFNLPAVEYIRLSRLQNKLSELTHIRMQGLDGLVGPTTPLTPQPVNELDNVSTASAFVARSLSYTRASNVYDMCAMTIPIPGMVEDTPFGFQVACSAKEETKLLSIANAISSIISTEP